MESKVKLEFEIPEHKIIKFNGKDISVKPFLSVSEEIFLINDYIKNYFKPKTEKVEGLIPFSKYFYLEAEYGLMFNIYQLCTNIETEGFDQEVYSYISLWEQILKEITNYWKFREKLNFILNEIKQQISIENSVGYTISSLIEKASNFVDSISDIKPEEISKIIEDSNSLLSKIENNPQVKESQAENSKET